ncbi:MAG: PilZ domain-containing protein [Desulfuromonadales bacterium]
MSEDQFDRRKAERHYALNFLDYEVLDDSGKVVGRGMGRTLDVSEAGLRLETGHFLEAGQRLRLTLSLENDLIQVTGRVVHSQPKTDPLCSCGILFIAFAEEDQRRYQKHFAALQTTGDA